MHGIIQGAGRLWVAALLGVLLTITWLPEQAAAQGRAGAALEQIEDAFAKGDSRVLMRAAADRVEIALLGENTTYSRSQAAYVLEAFFRRYPPVRCEFNGRETARTDGNWFAAGHYWHGSASRPLRVYVGLRLKDSVWELREIRIDEQSGK